MAKAKKSSAIIAQNRRASFDYELMERFEAGLVLQGSEVKSIRAGKAMLQDAYGVLRGDEIFLLNAHIAPYQAANFSDHEPTRSRKVLLHRSEINKLIGKIREKGLTLVATKLYFKDGRVKIELALGKSKKTIDKRHAIKKRESDRDLRRVLKERSK